MSTDELMPDGWSVLELNGRQYLELDGVARHIVSHDDSGYYINYTGTHSDTLADLARELDAYHTSRQRSLEAAEELRQRRAQQKGKHQ